MSTLNLELDGTEATILAGTIRREIERLKNASDPLEMRDGYISVLQSIIAKIDR